MDYSTPDFPVLHISWSLLRFMSIESMMLSNHLILCLPLLLMPSVFPSPRVFSNESALRIRWPKYGNFSFSISPYNEYSGLISLLSKGLSSIFFSTTFRKHQYFIVNRKGKSGRSSDRFSFLVLQNHYRDCSHGIKRHTLEGKLW